MPVNAEKINERIDDETVQEMLSLLDPAKNLFALAGVIAKRVNGAVNAQLEERHNLTLADWRVMMTLKQSPELTAAEITDKWGMDKMTTKRAVNKLEERDLLVRTRHTTDLRCYHLSLTEKGEDVFRDILPIAFERYTGNTSCFNPAQSEVLRHQLRQLADHVSTLKHNNIAGPR